MGKHREKPDLESVGVNPFSVGLGIPVNRKYYDVVNKFADKDKLEFTLEATPYTKIFEVAGYKQKMIDLPLQAKALLLYVIHFVDGAADVIWIPRRRYMEANHIRSVNTYKEAVKSLSDASYIYPHVSMRDVYWINPYYFFKGDRVRKYPNNIIVK